RRRHAAPDREVVACQLRPQFRRAPLRGVGLDDPREPVEPRFVHEDQPPALATRPLQPLRPDRATPALDRRLAARDGPPDRYLGRPAEFLEPAGAMALVVGDPELLLTHLGDAGTGPDLTPEPVSLGTMPEELGDQPALKGCAPRGSPRTGTSEQS